MANSRVPGPIGRNASKAPTRLPIGFGTTALIVDSPGSLGINDYAQATPRTQFSLLAALENVTATKKTADQIAKISVDKFLQGYQRHFGTLKDSPKAGLTNLIGILNNDTTVNDIPWMAYMLATVRHECARTWQPIEEFGKGTGHAYGKKIKVKGSDGIEYENAYYGRGYVQLTWLKNYQNASQKLVLGDDLVIHPEHVLQSDIAYKIMSLGMQQGWFTGAKLSDYLNDTHCDYYNARRIINGVDCADVIKDAAVAIDAILRAGSQ